MSSGLYSGVSGIALGTGLYRSVSGLWSGASGLIADFGGAFSPASLFAASEPGGWYDPSDLTTLFQDSAGTTPVTAAGQSVGLWLDKSQGLVLGSELWANQTPTISNAAGSVGVYDSGTRTMTNSGSLSSGYPRFQFNLGLVTGRTYFVTGVLNGSRTQVQRIRLAASGTANDIPYNNTTGVFSGYVIANGASLEFVTELDGAESLTIASISARLLPGNHLTQSSASQRGIYGTEPFGGRRNLLTYTEEFNNAAWTKLRASVTPDATTAPNGTATADKLVEDSSASNTHIVSQTATIAASTSYTFSVYLKASERSFARILVGDTGGTNAVRVDVNLSDGTTASGTNGTGWSLTSASATAVGDGWYRVVVSGANTSATSGVAIVYMATALGTIIYTGNGTSGLFLWGAQLETGTTATAYQKVVSAFDVSQAGVTPVYYVQFDGSDDGYVSPTITPGVNTAQVFAGVRKLSDAAIGMVAEISASTATNNGAFYLAAPVSTSVAGRNEFSSKGTTIASAQAVSAAPVTAVFTGLGDIAADTSILRANGAQVGSSSADQGTGNYLAYPLYVGRRGGASLPFNGRIYSLIVRFGANLPLATIQQTETWVNSKTGAY